MMIAIGLVTRDARGWWVELYEHYGYGGTRRFGPYKWHWLARLVAWSVEG